MALPCSFLLSLLVLSLPSISYCAVGTTNYDAPAAKDAIIQYWRLKFPGKHPPPFFLSKLISPLSPLHLMATSNFHGSHAINADASIPEKYRQHATASYDSASDAYRNPMTVSYNSDPDAYMQHATANYDSKRDTRHAAVSYDSHAYGNHATVHYDATGDDASNSFADASIPEKYRQHATANYDSEAYRNPITVSYNSDPDAYRNPFTASDDSKTDTRHATVNYDSHAYGNHATVHFDATGDDASNSKAHGVHATTNIRMVAGDRTTEKVAKRPSHGNSVFFREINLTKGTIMPMCNIKSTMPQLPLLPRSVATMLPFTSPTREVKELLRVPEYSRMSKEIDGTISTCESAPSKGEAKACLTSAEDVIDFISLKLGPNTVLKRTESARGSEGNIMIGEVKSVKGDELTKLVACHQVVFPYMVYLCHSVPRAKMYEADILNAETKEKVNHGVAICHFDTSNWSRGHLAFAELGSKPGEIEVCHWIFEGEMAAYAE